MVDMAEKIRGLTSNDMSQSDASFAGLTPMTIYPLNLTRIIPA